MRKRKKKWTGKYNAMAVFDIPVKVEGVEVYGLLLRMGDDDDMERQREQIEIYLNTYLIPMSRMYEKGEYKDGKWYFPQHRIDVVQNPGLYRLFDILFDNLVGVRLIRNGNISNRRNEANGEFITDPALIDRYCNPDKENTN